MGNFPDKPFYRPEFAPWLGYGEFAEYQKLTAGTLLGNEKLFYLYNLFLCTTHVLGDVVECGVYRGGSARMLVNLMANKTPQKKMHLFDTFTGIPEATPQVDAHKVGDFGDVILDEVKNAIGHDERAIYHVGLIPDTFKGLEGCVFSFVHVDVDTYKSYLECMSFLWPRMSVGGIMVFDDYGHPNCLGARKAVDEFFASRHEHIIVLPKGQACVIKMFA